MVSKRWTWSFLVLLVLGTLLSACGGGTDPGKTTIKMFFHSGQGPERDAINASIKAFEAQNTNIHVELVNIPEDGYDQQLAAAAISHTLPCILDVNGPNVYNYAWSGYLTPLDSYVTDDLKSDLLPTIIKQGTYNNHIYSLGQYDAGLGLYANKKYLTEAGLRIPTFDDPWTLDEFNSALAKLKNVSGVQYPMGMMMSYPAKEWFTFAFSPFLQSFGGDLINRNGYQTANGVLNGSESVAAMTWFQNLFKQGYVNPHPADDNDFPTGKSALNWSGHWMYSTYKQQLHDDLVLLPAPNLGKGAKTGMGSWSFGVTPSSSCKNQDEAWKVVNFLLSADQIKAMTDANSAVPGRKSVVANSSLYADNGPLHIFVQQLQSDVAMPRPLTSAYPTITAEFTKAVQNIVANADVKSELDKAVQTIDKDIKDNGGYQPR